MENRITGLHHITAIAGNAQRNFDFYTKVLGQRLVKKTVNFDDPGTYHFYFGNEVGAPGTILTFFPWEGIQRGKLGVGMATEIGYSVPAGSLPFWEERLKALNVNYQPVAERFGEQYLALEDPDGLLLNLVVPSTEDKRKGWTSGGIGEAAAIKGFHSVVLTLRNIRATASILTDIFGYKQVKQEGDNYRFATDAVDSANIVDMVEIPTGLRGVNAGGTNHHIAFRVPNEEVLMYFREKVKSAGLNITEKIDRNYFYSLYFREPGGVLFEIATDNPGFATDESVAELGTHLMLPPQYEPSRERIEQVLPSLHQ
jgi:glyoxalase family protein